MPKLKRTSSALCARKAKKRKRSQRQERQHYNPRSDSNSEASFEESRRDRNAEAHRSARHDPEKRQLERERDSAAHREMRLQNQERRQEEQERDTIGSKM